MKSMLRSSGIAINLYCWWTVQMKPQLLFPNFKVFAGLDSVRSCYSLYDLSRLFQRPQSQSCGRWITYASSGVSCTGSFVKAGSKCSKSRSPFSWGLYGGGICFCCNMSQSMVRKNACDWMSEKPDCGWQPSRSLWFWKWWVNNFHSTGVSLSFK